MGSLIDVARHENKLRRIIQLNKAGVSVFTDKTSQMLAFGSSKSEFIEAFKDDIDKTARYLTDSLGIINSVSNGLVMELSTLDNTVESFFGNTYKEGLITLCGVAFNTKRNTNFDKSELVDFMYSNLFDISRKDLNNLVKALTKYETAEDDIERAVLYPTTILADKLIEKIGYIDNQFNQYRKSLSYEENIEFTAIFNRSGVTDVIQNSTYIDTKGVRQTIPVHKNQLHILSEISEGIKSNNYKYIEAIEIDGDGDVLKALKVIKQIERLKINCESKFTLKFRKLGNLNARGVFFSAGLIVAEDVRDTSALIHEIAHFIHLTNPYIFESKFVNYMISKLRHRIDLDNLDISDFAKDDIQKKSKYYNDSKEIIARALEIAALFANENSRVIFGTDDMDMIKSRFHYEAYEGIYFNFNSFDEQTIDEMLQLWELFYETSYDKTQVTGIDNFYKIDTNYRRAEIEKVKTIEGLLKDEKKKELKKMKLLYSLVNGQNIRTIIENRPETLSLQKLARNIFNNISICGGHNQTCTAEEWAEIKEDKAQVVMTLIDTLKETFDERGYIMYLIELEHSKTLDNLSNGVRLNGFSNLKFKKEVRDLIEAKNPNGAFKAFNTWYSSISRTPLQIANSEILNDIEFIIEYINKNPFAANVIGKLEGISIKTIVQIGYFMLDNFIDKKSFIPEACFSDFDFAFKYLTLTKDVISFYKINSDLKNSVTFMNGVLKSFEGDLLITAFSNIGKNLSTDIEFMEYWIKQEPKLIKYVDESIKFYFEPKKEEVIKPPKKKQSVAEMIADAKESQIEYYERLIKNAKIVDFPHTKTGKLLKVLKIFENIKNFNDFKQYLINNGIASCYSPFAKGFIIKNIEKVACATISATIYSPDVLANFANGTLF